ncbi:MAG: transcriptional regulator [Paenibacillaceae bacterium]|jgi:DNA-binding transcriptional LysR family regulator|nr:transcriptional regulator [Paenibacillaceae bacterium]
MFYYAAQSGSLTKAAAELNITQPAVTYAIKRLEASLGGQLFFRTPKGIRLTSEGEVLFRYVEQAYNFIGIGERKIFEMHQLQDGEMKIGAGDTLCRHYLLPYLEEFHNTYPGVKIQVTNRTTPETVDLLKRGGIDFGIVNLPITEPSLDIRESFAIEDGFVAGPKYRFLAEETLPLKKLAEHPLLLLEKGSSTRTFIDRFFAKHQIEIRPEIELGSVDLLVEFARKGFGIACVVKNFIADDLARGELHEIKLATPLPPRKIGIVTLKHVPISHAAARFIERLP